MEQEAAMTPETRVSIVAPSPASPGIRIPSGSFNAMDRTGSRLSGFGEDAFDEVAASAYDSDQQAMSLQVQPQKRSDRIGRLAIFRNASILTRFQNVITQSFLLFETKNGSRRISRENVENVLHALSCVPSQKDVQEFIKDAEDPLESNETISLERFLPIAMKVLIEKKFQPATPEKLLRAFKMLDSHGKGYLTAEEMTRIFTTEGSEPLNTTEMEAMLATALAATRQANEESDDEEKSTSKEKNQDIVKYADYVWALLDQ